MNQALVAGDKLIDVCIKTMKLMEKRADAMPVKGDEKHAVLVNVLEDFKDECRVVKKGGPDRP